MTSAESTAHGLFDRLTRRTYLSLIGASGVALASGSAAANENTEDETIAAKFRTLSRGTEWTQVSDAVVDFDTHHPQGMTRVGDHLFVSSVEVYAYPEKYDEPRNGTDRTTGDGVGHLFKFTLGGELVDSITLSEGSMYHPGGIDFDGESIWVPVAEYRPNSESVVYRVNPETMDSTEAFRYTDHIGGVIHDTDAGTLNGVSWGSRRFYTWNLTGSGKVTNADRSREELAVQNPEHYIDYQDAQYLGGNLALCSGLASFEYPDGTEFTLGGLDLVDLRENRPIYQIPVAEWEADGRPMTQNPFYVEEREGGLRFYFMPEDDTSHLFVYDVEA